VFLQENSGKHSKIASLFTRPMIARQKKMSANKEQRKILYFLRILIQIRSGVLFEFEIIVR
jgi:hypothetical protein